MEQQNRKRVPIFAYVFFGIAALSVVIYIIAILSTDFADFFNCWVFDK